MSYSLSHLADHVLLRDLATLVSQDRATTAALLAHIAEVDERRLYASKAYPSMFMYCVHELRMSDDAAGRRINVARAAREFPAIFPALADGRLNLTGVLLLAPHLKPETADELLAAAAYQTKEAIRLLLAERFPQSDAPTLLQPVPAGTQHDPEQAASSAGQHALEHVDSRGNSPVPEQAAAARPRVAPLSPGRFALQVTVDQPTHDQLRYAQSLLGHAVSSGDVATVLKRALDALMRELEKKKFAKGVSTRPRRGSKNSRHVPAEIRRTVWQRDDGQCTFVSSDGRRCEERGRVEFDHIEPLARGGRTVASNLRLRCRAHNQYEAERAFGSDFMRGKRDQARRRAEQAKASVQAEAEADAKARADAGDAKARSDAAEARARTQAEARAQADADARARADAAARANAEAAARTAAEAAARAAAEAAAAHAADAAAAQAAKAAAAEVIPFLLHLGFNAKEARQGATHAARIADAPLEQRVRVALQNLAPPCVRFRSPGHAPAPPPALA